jgi:hypothetical protein
MPSLTACSIARLFAASALSSTVLFGGHPHENINGNASIRINQAINDYGVFEQLNNLSYGVVHVAASRFEILAPLPSSEIDNLIVADVENPHSMQLPPSILDRRMLQMIPNSEFQIAG